MKHKNTAYIDRAALVRNYETINEITAHAALENGQDAPTVICVVKADAYGHGTRATAEVLGAAGCGFFAVSSEEEADELRRIERENGRHPEILILSRVAPENVGDMIDDDITCALVSAENARELRDAAQKYRESHKNAAPLKVHIALDTGMNRVGFPTDGENAIRTADAIKELAGCADLRLCGIFTHFSCADDELMDGKFVPGYENGYTSMQLERYKNILALLRERGVDPGLRHAANSAAVLKLPEAYFDAVRAGVILYGLMPNGEVDARFSPAMKFCSTVTHIHKIEKGEKISYGATYESDRPMVLATVAAGYADGFERAYSGCEVLIKGKKFRQVGRICMDQFMVDITGDETVAVGDEVTLFGGDSGETVNALAKRAGTINYEVICKVSKRVTRVIEN